MTTRAWSYLERELEIRLGFTSGSPPEHRADLVAAAKEVERGNWHISDAETFLCRVYNREYQQHSENLRWHDDRTNRMIRFEDGVVVTYAVMDGHDLDNCKVFDCRICLVLSRGPHASHYFYGRSGLEQLTDQVRLNEERIRLAAEYMRETTPQRFVTEDGPRSTASFRIDPYAQISDEMREAARQLAFNAGQQIETLAAGLMVPKELLEPTPEPKPAIEITLPLGGRRIVLE